MGKPVDSRSVEYAYALRMIVYPNTRHVTGREVIDNEEVDIVEYRHDVTITYDLKDIDKKKLPGIGMKHTIIVGDTKDDVRATVTKINANLRGFVKEDKLSLSGFDIGN